jgi:hypothetical protein
MKVHRWSLSLKGGGWTVRFLAVSLVLAGWAGPSFAGDVKVSVDQIPKATGPLKRLKLSRSDVQTEFTRKVLANVAPGASLEPLSQSKFATQHGITGATNVQAAVDNDHVVAVVDAAKGHVDVFPVLDKLTPAAASSDGKTVPAMPKAAADQASKVAAGVLAQGVFGSDASHAVLDKMVTLNAATFNKGTGNAAATMDKSKSGPVLASFPVMRMVGTLPVFGVGSHGLISVDAAGKINGFSKHWQTASDNDQVTETRTPAQIVDLIKQQLAGLASKGDVVVQDVKLGYYDGDEKFIQPVYQFRAKVSYTPQGGAKVVTDDDFIAGYIPIGEVLEPIPSMLDKVQSPPAVPQGAPTNLPLASLCPTEPPDIAGATQVAAGGSSNTAAAAPEGDPTVGRYVVRNDYGGWVNSANGFWNGIQASGWGGWFTNSQYYWAYPFEFQGSKNSYINAVNVAEVEVHGDWWSWATYQSWGDGVTVNSIPSPGLGGSAGGVCAYFIIHSCEVVPSAADTGSWSNNWWHIFGGLHSVLGYRTIMYIDDGIMWPFGRHMGWGSMLVSSWLNDVVSSSYYWGSPGQVMHGVWKPYGRPSTISVCGHENDSVYYTASLGYAGCLVNYWYY